MITLFLIIAAIVVALFIGFFTGMWVGVGCGMDAALEDDNEDFLLHCFECEIEMPVKEKNGKLFCSNCGLCH